MIFPETKAFVRFLILSCAVLFTAESGLAQESSSKSVANSAPNEVATAGGPSAALKAVLSAACSQNQTEFVRFLTARNKEAFSRMTPVARIALMKRFVLLNQPGKPSASANPMELREVTDTTGASVHQVTMGLVREDGEWKLLSLGVLFLDLPALEVEWDAEQMDAAEESALEAVKKVALAVEAYRNKYSHLPESLAKLGPPLHGAANGEAAGLVDSDLANGIKNGYGIRYVVVGASTLGAPAKYEVAATPQQYGRTGLRSFFRDSSGGLHAADRQGAVGGVADPKVE